jgi:hypothetical protein
VDLTALDGSDDDQLFCFRDCRSGIQLLYNKRQEDGVPVPVLQTTSVDASNCYLDMGVDEIEDEQENEENEVFIDSEDDEEDNAD